jgi:hypothetical protein
MEEVKEVKEELITKGGYKYIIKEEIIDLGNGLEGKSVLIVRNSTINRRLTEDDETYPEYKLRLKMAKHFEKQQKKGTLVWPSKRILTEEDRRTIEKEGPSLLNDYRKLNLGTYDEEKLEKYVEKLRQDEAKS